MKRGRPLGSKNFTSAPSGMTWERCLAGASKALAMVDSNIKDLKKRRMKLKSSVRFFEEQIKAGNPFPL